MNDNTVVDIDAARVVRVYSGKPGCACGCRGNYSKNPAAITRVVRAMRAALMAPDPVRATQDADGVTVCSDSRQWFAIYTN